MKTEELAGILVKTGLVQTAAVEDPEGYDNYATVGRISEAAALIDSHIVDEQSRHLSGYGISGNEPHPMLGSPDKTHQFKT